jgi:hypothetical protein
VSGALASPGGVASTTFTLNLIACDSTVITNPTITDQSFQYEDSSNTFSMTAFTESFGVCAPFTYTVIKSNGFPIPSLLSFDATTLLFTVSTSSIMTTASYTIKVLGSLPSPGGSAYVTFTLSLTACDGVVITSTAIPDQSYSYNDASNTFSMTAFTES